MNRIKSLEILQSIDRTKLDELQNTIVNIQISKIKNELSNVCRFCLNEFDRNCNECMYRNYKSNSGKPIPSED
jgi:hypothetical protein